MGLLDTPGSQSPGEDGRLHGVARGVVTDNRDPDGLGRVRVQLSWQEQGASYWARVAVPMAGSGYGACFLPEIGDEVLVAAENGDPALIYVLGMLWSGTTKPPVMNADGKNDLRVIRSRAGHQLLFDDSEGAGILELKLADGKRVTLDREGVAIDDAAGNHILIRSGSAEIAVTSRAKLTLKAAQVVIEAEGALDIKSGGTLTLRGSVVDIN